MPRVRTVLPNHIASEAGGGDSPSFGDDPNDVAVFQPTFDYADAAAAADDGWSSSDGWGGDTSVISDDGPTGAHTSSFEMVKDAGTGGPAISASVSFGSGDEILFNYYAKITSLVDTQIFCKWFIMDHDRTGVGSGRYQLSVTRFSVNGLENDDHARYAGIGESDGVAEEGPVNSADSFYPGFMWDNGQATPHNEEAPVLSGDGDSAGRPWTMLDEGWLKFTGRIILGEDGASSWAEFWLGDTLVYDSEGNDMWFRGIPQNVKWELTSGDPSSAFTVRYSGINLWKRVIA